MDRYERLREALARRQRGDWSDDITALWSDVFAAHRGDTAVSIARRVGCSPVIAQRARRKVEGRKVKGLEVLSRHSGRAIDHPEAEGLLSLLDASQVIPGERWAPSPFPRRWVSTHGRHYVRRAKQARIFRCYRINYGRGGRITTTRAVLTTFDREPLPLERATVIADGGTHITRLAWATDYRIARALTLVEAVLGLGSIRSVIAAGMFDGRQAALLMRFVEKRTPKVLEEETAAGALVCRPWLERSAFNLRRDIGQIKARRRRLYENGIQHPRGKSS